MSGDGAFDYNMRYIRVNSYLTSIHDSDGDYMTVADTNFYVRLLIADVFPSRLDDKFRMDNIRVIPYLYHIYQ